MEVDLLVAPYIWDLVNARLISCLLERIWKQSTELLFTDFKKDSSFIPCEIRGHSRIIFRLSEMMMEEEAGA